MEESESVLRINCDDCVMAGTDACSDCIVTYLCNRDDGGAVVMPGSLFVTNNILEGDRKVNQNNWRGMGYSQNKSPGI